MIERRPHLIGRSVALAHDQRVLRWIFAAIGAVLGGWQLFNLLVVVALTGVLTRDFIQDYLLVRALVDGLDPNLPVRVLADHYGFRSDQVMFRHPTPHTPTLGLMLLPLAWLDYTTASVVWLSVSFGALLLAVSLLLRFVQSPATLRTVVPISLTLIIWEPVFFELFLGQVTIIMLAALTGVLLALRSARTTAAGLLLALALLLKPVAWPVLALLAVRRQWRLVATASTTTALGYGIAALVIGPGRLIAYFTTSLPTATMSYRGDPANISIANVGWRLYSGYSPVSQNQIPEATVASARTLSAPEALAVVMPLVVLVVCFWLTRELALDWSIGVMICASIAVSPVAWVHSLVLAMVLLAHVIATLSARGWPVCDTNASLFAVGVLLVPFSFWTTLSKSFFRQDLVAPEVVAIGALLTFAPTLGVLALAWSAVRLERGWSG